MDIPQPLPWEQRKNGRRSNAGGIYRLSGIFPHNLRTRGTGGACRTKNWWRGCAQLSTFPSKALVTASRFYVTPGSWRRSEGIVTVDERIRHWMKNGGDHIPIAMIHSRLKFVGEMLSELEEPKSAEALRKAASRYGLDWKTYTQINNRRGWLQSANLIEGAANRLKLTDAGRHLLGRLNIYVPSQSTEDSHDLNASQRFGRSKPRTRESVAISVADRLADEIAVASTESADHSRFERLVRDAFALMGFVAKHLGAPGNTDVLLTAPLGRLDSYHVAVDAKTTASGSLNDNQVDWATLREHRNKHDANFSLLVAPSPSGNRLMNRAQEFSVAVLSADQLADLCRRHRTCATEPGGLQEAIRHVRRGRSRGNRRGNRASDEPATAGIFTLR